MNTFGQRNSLRDACYLGDKDSIKLLLRSGEDVNQYYQDIDATPLIIAALEGHAEIVEILVGADADTNTTGNNGYTPLLYAAYLGHIAVARALIDGNADVNKTDKKGRTAITWAAYNGHVEVVKILLSAKVDINKADDDGITPIIAAAQKATNTL